MNALANVLLFIFGASVLYGVILSRPRPPARTRREHPETAPVVSPTTTRRVRSGLVRPDLIAEGFRHGAPMRWNEQTIERVKGNR